MSYVVAGAISGFLMASVFIAISPIMLFILAKEPSPKYQLTLGKLSPTALMMSIVALAYPTWAVIGVATGLLYSAVDTENSSSGTIIPNLSYTITIVFATIVLAVPIALLLKRVLLGVVTMALLFAGIFGWALPFFAH